MNIWTKRINDLSQHSHLAIHVAAQPVQNGHADPTKMTVDPAPNEQSDKFAPLLRLYAAIATCLCPTGDHPQKAGVHAIEDI